MKVNKIALVGGAILIAIGGMGAIACSSSTTSTPGGASNNPDSGAPVTGEDGSTPVTGEDSSTPVTGNDSGTPTPGTDSGTACAKPPALHVPVADGGVYCPYSYNDATDAGIQYCSGATPQCCVSASTDAGSSDCEAVGACANSTSKVWQCSAPSDCASYGAGMVCCLISGTVGPDKNCSGFQKTAGLDSVTCMLAADCVGPIEAGSFVDTHYIACEQQSDCATGTCTPVHTSGTPIGLCL